MNIEENLILSLSHSLLHFSTKKSSYKFQCPYCQYGRKNSKNKSFAPSEASGYLYRGTHGWNFKCHREKHCGRGMSFTTFLEENFPKHFESYVRLREEMGTTGKYTNCPKLETVLKRQGMLPEGDPDFSWQGTLPPVERGQQDPPGRHQCPPVTPNTPSAPKITKLPPMRSPQQQAGHQAKINQGMKQRAKIRLQQSGELW
jgi:hypothetical protein